jgi:hypothetical protein
MGNDLPLIPMKVGEKERRRRDFLLEVIHDQIAHDARAWHSQAEMLIDSSEVLFKSLPPRTEETSGQHTRYGACGLLLGCALECIFKGMWVARGQTLVRDGKLVKIPNTGAHQLGPLARETKAEITQEEYSIIDALSYFILATGRYPIPREATDLGQWRKDLWDSEMPPDLFDDEEWDTARAITRRLLRDLAVLASQSGG